MEELLSLLQAVIKDDQEEIRLRMSFLAKKYPIAIGEPDLRPKNLEQPTTLLSFRCRLTRSFILTSLILMVGAG